MASTGDLLYCTVKGNVKGTVFAIEERRYKYGKEKTRMYIIMVDFSCRYKHSTN